MRSRALSRALRGAGLQQACGTLECSRGWQASGSSQICKASGASSVSVGRRMAEPAACRQSHPSLLSMSNVVSWRSMQQPLRDLYHLAPRALLSGVDGTPSYYSLFDLHTHFTYYSRFDFTYTGTHSLTLLLSRTTHWHVPVSTHSLVGVHPHLR